MDFWQKARGFAEEAAKRSQELTKEAAKRSQDLTIGSSKISDLVSDTTRRSKEIAAEASKRADQIRIEALRRADKLKSLADQLPAGAISLVDSSAPSPFKPPQPQPVDLERFGVTDDLREFVRGITSNTFREFPLEDDTDMSDVPTVSNVQQDLTEWQERHASLVLSTVKEISKLRYELCPRVMKERKFWRIYFILVNSHVAPYEKRYMEEEKLKSAEQLKEDEGKGTLKDATMSKPELKGVKQLNKTSTSSTEQDLDVFLLGDLGDSDDGADDGEGDFDDFDKMDSSEDEKQK